MMLADSIEATVKSLPKPTPKRIDDVVADTVEEEASGRPVRRVPAHHARYPRSRGGHPRGAHRFPRAAHRVPRSLRRCPQRKGGELGRIESPPEELPSHVRRRSG